MNCDSDDNCTNRQWYLLFQQPQENSLDKNFIVSSHSHLFLEQGKGDTRSRCRCGCARDLTGSSGDVDLQFTILLPFYCTMTLLFLLAEAALAVALSVLVFWLNCIFAVRDWWIQEKISTGSKGDIVVVTG